MVPKQPKKVARQQSIPTAPSSSKPVKATSSFKTTTTRGSGRKNPAVPGDNDVLTFKQKDLSESIQTLDGQKLEKAVQIIDEAGPGT